jgi:DNA polymerase I
MASKSYWSYGKVNHKDGALIPEGRVLIDTAKSFVYTEGGLKGVLMAFRLSGLSPNLTSRFAPGTLISSYEVFEALRRGVAVPFRKRDAESIRNISELKASDKGGMIFQPEHGDLKIDKFFIHSIQYFLGYSIAFRRLGVNISPILGGIGPET